MKRIIISGGGTGGHVFPAIAIARALKSRLPDADILFIGARGRMEMEKVPAAGFPIEGLPVTGFQRRITWKNVAFPFKLAGSLVRAYTILSRFRPDLVIGVGGYASGPTLRMAALRKIPTLIQEQNSFPGITNRLLAGKAEKICVAYEGMEKYFPAGKIVLTGNPIRRELTENKGTREEALGFFGLDRDKKTLLVIGGSLGARTINQAVMKFVTGQETASGIQALWQTGKYYYDGIAEAIPDPCLSGRQAASRNLRIFAFIDRMDMAYTAADIIVSRAGAIAISELCVVGKPVILIPSPNVAADHQTKNARALSEKDAALMIRDADAEVALGPAILALVNDPVRQAKMSASIRMLGIGDAAEKIADVALSLVRIKPNANLTVGEKPPVSVYLLGIGGIGMSALARYFSLLGARVSGYDKTRSDLTARLESEGIRVHYTEDPARIPADPDLVIYTPAIPADHREMVFLREKGIILHKRAEVLGMISRRHKTIAVAGTHGKTTTSAMIAHLLRTAGVDCMAFLGGISNNYDTNFLPPPAGYSGSFPDEKTGNLYCIAEADEYDRSFLHLSPYIAIITAVDADHLDIYGTADDLKKSYAAFTSGIVPGGSLVMNSGALIAPESAGNYTVHKYALSPVTGFYPENIRLEDDLYHFDLVTPSGRIDRLALGIPGKFNLENAMAALAVGHLIGLDEKHIRQALLTFKGVHRRFDFRIRRPDFVYIDDYAHHPEELRACIGAARDLYPGKRITGVFQPHLFSRTRDFADEFARSLELLDELILLDIYPAREKPIPGVTSGMLLDRIKLSVKEVVPGNGLIEAIKRLHPEVLLTLGAGDIDRFVAAITGTFLTETAK